MVDDPTGDRGIDRLRLLASAIGGCTLGIADAGAGQRAWTDGTTVFVDAHADPTDQVRVVAVQASLLAAGSLTPDIVRQLVRRPALARRYLAIEGHRALAANEALLPDVARTLMAGTSADAGRRWEADGAARTDRGLGVSAGAGGATPARARGRRSATEPPGSLVRPPVDHGLGAGDGDPERSLAIARGRWSIDDPPEPFGVIRPRRLLAALERADVGAPARDEVSRPLSNQARPDLDELHEVDDETGDDEARSVGHLLSNPVGGEGVLGRLLRRLLSPIRAPGGGGPAGADRPGHVGRARSRGRGQTTAALVAPGDLHGGARFAPQARTYPEWDVHRKRYRPDWCTVHERDPRPGDLVPMAMPDGRALRRPLARLGTGLVRTRRQPQGDDIDVDAAVEARVEALAGSPPHEAVYVESLRQRRDLAVLVLLDVSGSAGEPGPAGRPVHDHQRTAAAALTTALHDLGDRVALYAFNSQGRRAVHVWRVKGFDDRLDGRAAQHLGGLVPGAYTRLGAAIRHGGSVLHEWGGTSRRLLLVLSDGFAYDHGYEGRYGEADARRALAEVRRQGTGCLCLSVGAATGPGALRRVFGTAAHATVPTADQLAGSIGPLFRIALRSAEVQRRAFQRHERLRTQLEIDRRTA